MVSVRAALAAVAPVERAGSSLQYLIVYVFDVCESEYGCTVSRGRTVVPYCSCHAMTCVRSRVPWRVRRTVPRSTFAMTLHESAFLDRA